jgi:molecular chaperone GrpE
MTKRKDESKPQAEATPEAAPAGSDQPVAGLAVSMEEFEALKAQFAEAESKKQEYLDALQRERADFTNYRRRIEVEKEQMGQWTTGETIKKLLPVLDDLERALANRPAGDTWADGVDLICRKFQSILEKENIVRIEAEGKPFDPTLHEAIMQEPSDSHEPGTVIAVLRQGYMQGERILRPALVKVAQ